MTVSRPSAEIAITARVCILYGDFSGRSDSRFSCFESPVVPREKRVLLSVQRLVATASGPALIISRVVSCWASRFGWILPTFHRVPVDRYG